MISVIIPTYQPNQYFFELLSALANQTFPLSKYEIIIVLNGNKDPWFNMVSKWVKDLHITNARIIYTPIAGVSNARNLGINEVSGRYISFLDDDDLITSTYLNDLYGCTDKNKHTIVISNTNYFLDGNKSQFIDNSLTRLYNKFQNNQNLSLFKLRGFFNGPCMKLIPKDIIGQTRFNNKFKNKEDSLFMFEISNKIDQIVLAPESAIYFRRIRKNSATTTKRPITYHIKNAFSFISQIGLIYIRAPFSYNVFFMFSRVLAPVKSILKILVKS